MSRPRKKPSLTATSYAVLGLLALRPWTTYELAKQMERTLYRIWPRARSKLYEEPKKLVAHGLATATDERVGKRPRTVYAITPAGRGALAAWLATPGEDGIVLVSETLVKLFFADQGTTQDALDSLEALRAWAVEQLDAFAEATDAYLAGGGPFPERAAVNIVNGRLMVDLYAAVEAWAGWAAEVMGTWPADPARAEPDWEALEETHRRALRSGRRPGARGQRPSSDA